MVSKDQIREEGLTKEEVLDGEVAEPETEVTWVEEWDETEGARPGENTRIEDDKLKWERKGFEVRLESHETTHWLAVVTVPEKYGEYTPREVDAKTGEMPDRTHVEDVVTEDYRLQEVTLLIGANFQPVWEVNRWIDIQIEEAEGFREFRDELAEKLDVAGENET